MMDQFCQKNKKCTQILSVARELFWRYGFKRVSIEEICSKSKTSKMTFYRYFRNKTELAKAIIDLEIERGKTGFRAILEDESTPVEKMKNFILLKTEGTHDISKEFLQDLYLDAESELAQHLAVRSKETWVELIDDLKKAQQEGWIRSDLKPEFLIILSQKFAEILGDETILKYYPEPGELINEITRMLVYGIGNRG
jgi:AcrR family transcriptional regulator